MAKFWVSKKKKLVKKNNQLKIINKIKKKIIIIINPAEVHLVLIDVLAWTQKMILKIVKRAAKVMIIKKEVRLNAINAIN